MRSQLSTEFFPSVILPVYTDGHIQSVFIDGMTNEICRIKKRQFADMDVYAGDFSDGITEGFKMANPYGDVPCLPSELHGITDGIILSVNLSAKVNVCLLCLLCSFLLLLNPNSPLLQTTTPPKKKSPSSQHNKSYFLKFCGHSIRVLIYRWILSVFVSNSIFLNFNI
jgi:hypothetical protein